MCGIAGYIDLKKGISPQVLKKMTNIIKHRGPDDEGYMLFNTQKHSPVFGTDTVKDLKYNEEYVSIDNIKEDHFFMGFGHRRLSIIDLTSSGHQPMYDECFGTTITYNGEIYNYLEIKSELEKKGYRFKSHSDTEVILKSYEEWGERCVNRFNGMWAFAIYDQKNKVLFCSRDRLGVKPFYYYYDKTQQKFVFGSEIKQILVDSEIKRIINEKILSTELVWGVSDYNEETPIQNIYMLGAGENLILNLSNPDCIKWIKKEKYWKLQNNIHPLDQTNYADLVGETILDSIKLRMRSDAEVGALLSGGLDSSTLVTLIANELKEQNSSQHLMTFTSCYNDSPENDEKYFAQLINNHCGCDENLIYPVSRDIQSELEQIVWHTEGISRYGLIGSWQVINAAKKRGLKVLINGQAGDETMFGYERYYALFFFDLLKHLKFKTFYSEFRKGAENSKLSPSTLLQYLFYFNSPTLRKYRKRKQEKKFYTDYVFSSSDDREMKKLLFSKSLEELQINELLHTQLTHILRYDDRLYMGNSIESRVPFVDYRFVELAASIPNAEKIKGGFTKALIRQYMDTKMPKEVTWRTNKMGFGAPIERWAKGYSDEYLHTVFKETCCDKYFNKKAMKSLYESDPSNEVFQKFISTEMFFKLFKVECP